MQGLYNADYLVSPKDRLDPEVASELPLFRHHLEIALLKQAAKRAAPADVAGLRLGLSASAQGVAQRDCDAVAAADDSLHCRIAQIGQSRVLSRCSANVPPALSALICTAWAARRQGMAVYANADQVQRVAAELFARLGQNEEVNKRTSRLEVSFRFEIIDLGTSFTLVIDKGTLQFKPHDDTPPKSTLKMDSGVFHEAMAGTLNLPVALVNRTLVIEGDTRAVLNLTALGKALNTTYQAVFAELMPKEG